MSIAQGRSTDLPGYCAPTFTLMPVGSTPHRSVQVSGFDDIGRLTPMRRLYPLPVRQASALPSASFRFAVARDTLAVRLTLPLAGRVGDFHPQVCAPCRAHRTKSPLHAGLLLAAALSRYASQRSLSENSSSCRMPLASARLHQSCNCFSSCSREALERSHSTANSLRME